MAFALPEHWVWDFWFADDGDRFHLYYLHAPKSLADPPQRHRHARIGHAVSTDLTAWTNLGEVVPNGSTDEFDATSAWTGSIVADPAGGWRMFYTGARFLNPETWANIETIGAATSVDLHTWTKTGPVLSVDPRWYETLADGTWPEEACRDPWVYFDETSMDWRMLYTARARSASGEVDGDTGVIGLARSNDLHTWEALPPASPIDAGFQHLEVPQLISDGNREALLFSCPTDKLAPWRIARGETGGVWCATRAADGCFDIAHATLVLDQHLYSGRAIKDRDGIWKLLAFVNEETPTSFDGTLCDPMPLVWTNDGKLTLAHVEAR